MIIKTGPDLNSAISPGAEIHLFRIFPSCGKAQIKEQPVASADRICFHRTGKIRKDKEDTQKESRFWRVGMLKYG